jgi:hypothetical protein
MERINFENEKKYLQTKKETADEFIAFLFKFRTPEKRLRAKEAEVKVFFRDDEEKKKMFLSLFSSDFQDDFMLQKYIELMEPVIRMRASDPDWFEEKQREIFNLEGGFEPLNKMISYNLDGDNIKLHWAPSETLSNTEKIHFLKNSFVELEKILEIKKDIKLILLSSRIVGRNPAFFERFGFEIKDGLVEKVADSFASMAGVNDNTKTAFMSREYFLDQKFAEKFEKYI